MKMCKHCKEFADLFLSEFRNDKFWFGTMDTTTYCKTNFLDTDDVVKSCLMVFNEKLGKYLRSRPLVNRIKDEMNKKDHE